MDYGRGGDFLVSLLRKVRAYLNHTLAYEVNNPWPKSSIIHNPIFRQTSSSPSPHNYLRAFS